jgi:hypothetical protein
VERLRWPSACLGFKVERVGAHEEAIPVVAIIFLFASARCGRHVGSDCAQELLGSFVLPCSKDACGDACSMFRKNSPQLAEEQKKHQA